MEEKEHYSKKDPMFKDIENDINSIIENDERLNGEIPADERIEWYKDFINEQRNKYRVLIYKYTNDLLSLVDNDFITINNIDRQYTVIFVPDDNKELKARIVNKYELEQMEVYEKVNIDVEYYLKHIFNRCKINDDETGKINDEISKINGETSKQKKNKVNNNKTSKQKESK